MANQFAVLHVEKCRGNLTGHGKHIDRIVIPKNADPARQHMNAHMVESDRPLAEDVNTMIAARYKGKKALRSDAVKALKFALTGSHEQMTRIGNDPKQLKAWIVANRQFMHERFGLQNTVRFTLHMDEHTPHLHVVVVPMTKDGRLSAKEVLGGPKEMKQLQTDYAEAMKPFGLSRGLENSPAKHTDIREFYAMVNQPEKLLPEIPEKSMFESAETYRQKVGKAMAPFVAEVHSFRKSKRNLVEAALQAKTRMEDAQSQKDWAMKRGKEDGIVAERKRINAILAPQGVQITPKGELARIDPKNDQKRDQGMSR